MIGCPRILPVYGVNLRERCDSRPASALRVLSSTSAQKRKWMSYEELNTCVPDETRRPREARRVPRSARSARHRARRSGARRATAALDVPGAAANEPEVQARRSRRRAEKTPKINLEPEDEMPSLQMDGADVGSRAGSARRGRDASRDRGSDRRLGIQAHRRSDPDVPHADGHDPAAHPRGGDPPREEDRDHADDLPPARARVRLRGAGRRDLQQVHDGNLPFDRTMRISTAEDNAKEKIAERIPVNLSTYAGCSTEAATAGTEMRGRTLSDNGSSQAPKREIDRRRRKVATLLEECCLRTSEDPAAAAQAPGDQQEDQQSSSATSSRPRSTPNRFDPEDVSS